MNTTIGTTQLPRTPSPEYDLIAAIAADRFDVPIALVNIDDGEDVWVKAKIGLDLCSAPKDIAFCGHVLETAQPLIVEDLAADLRYHDHPLVLGDLHARFYAGVPLRNRHGVVFGTLCIVDRRPRTFGDRDLRGLMLLAEQVVERVELSELRHRERATTVIDQTTTDAFVTCDRHGRVTHWNAAAEALLGWPRDEALGRPITFIIPPAMRSAHSAGFDRLVASDSAQPMRVVEIPALRRDGTEVHVELTLGVHREGDDVTIVSILRDATARRLLEAEREASRMLTDAIVENMPAAIYAKDLTTDRYVFVNRAFEQLSGRGRQDIIGRSWGDVFPQADMEAYRRSTNAAMATSGPILLERTMTRPDGTVRQIEATKIRSVGPDGRMILLGFAQDVTEEREANQRLSYLAHHDPLTGLLNRTRFGEIVDECIAAGGTPAIICLDLDRFKIVNDLYGHAAGDEVLVEAAQRIVTASQSPVARLGGDEFAVLVADSGSAGRIARRTVDTLARPFGIRGHGVGIGASAGVAIHQASHGGDSDLVLRNADLALYRAKAEGRNQWCFFEPAMDDAARERRQVESDLRTALDRGEIHVEYQPLADAVTGTVISFEALARWDHPRLGRIPPSLFIPIAEESGIMPDLGRFVLEAAAAEAASWSPKLKVAVNLSPAQMDEDDLVAQVGRILAKAALPPRRLEIEITEGMLIKDTARGIRLLTEFRALGVSVSMDDFGTGYSSLTYFRTFPFDKVKIDQSFIRDMDENPQSLAIVQAVIGLGRGLGMPVVAEGVETHDQLERLRAEGCDVVQGYHIGRPAGIGSFKNGVILDAVVGAAEA
ncbi:EAL domain-containing protein [Sphingomonas sp. CARO-RG-8B-R24-01]|uniref:bifunctional diguanylate cyclase/phosphodiesterase n=1 Tax=Sphingomonas sp. CARO-RG-8B-R24-01 TaxID=2914831 RepID=UPI001F57E75B|nr:EAL domain-containing protein [Sphingomonas sp. CARO-RG-8B-R24-01]